MPDSAIKFPPPWFDLKSAIIGSLLMGTVVGLINYSHGLTPALTSAGKQAAYTFFFAGLIMQYCRWLAERDLPPWATIALATLWPTVITVILVFMLHSFRGTPEPVLSTIPPGLMGMSAYFLVSRNIVFGDLSDESEANTD